MIVDSGATSHAVGNIRLLEGFQPYSTPRVAKLADGSYLRILGTGRIERGNFSIPNVSLIEGLRDGLISTPQLDSDHGLISHFGNGVCRIMDTDGTEVGSAILARDGSYVLRFLNVPGPAQVQEEDEDPKLTCSKNVANASPCKWFGNQTIPTPLHSHEKYYMNPLHPKPPPSYTNPTQTFKLIM